MGYVTKGNGEKDRKKVPNRLNKKPKKEFLVFLLFLMWGILGTSVYAQSWTAEDSLRLQKLLQSEGEIELNSQALQELRTGEKYNEPHVYDEKPWLKFDTSVPEVPSAFKINASCLTLHPYTPTTPFDWDPVYLQHIPVHENTWRHDPFYHLKTHMIPTNWAKTPFDPGKRQTVEQIEATGLRYRFTERANNMVMGGWQFIGPPTGINLMMPFTRDFWRIRECKRRIRTKEELRMYGDSITVHERKVQP